MPGNPHEPPTKKVKVESKDDGFDLFMTGAQGDAASGLDAQINDILDEFNDIIEAEQLKTDTASDSTPKVMSPFDLDGRPHSSITSNEEVLQTKDTSHQDTHVNTATVFTLKQAMANTSRLIGTFTALKTTYLKLCKEFNYLLSKFNENEKIKIELIHENNQLRKLLVDTIKEKELDRKKYKADLALMKNF